MKYRRLAFISFIIISGILFIKGLTAIGVMSGNGNIIGNIISHKNGQKNNGYENNGREFAEPEGTPQAKVQEDGIIREKPVNLLVLGLDGDETRSDVIILVNYKPSENDLNMMSIARDTKVTVDKKTLKINALIGMGGEEMIMEEVEKLTGLDIDYYITLNFDGFKEIIDTLGGVDFNVPIDMNYDDPEQNLHIHLKKGMQHLDGDKAIQFVRYRKGNREGEGYIDGDIGRIKAQQDFLKALIQQKLNLKYVFKADDIYYLLKEHMKTNIGFDDVKRYLKYLNDIDEIKPEMYTLPGEVVYTGNTWYVIPDKGETEKLIQSEFK